MSDDPCAEMHLLVQADLDGELDAAGSARVAAHLARCPACAALSAELAELSARIRNEATRHRAPATWRARKRPGGRALAGAGAALAAGVALTLLIPHGTGFEDELAASHIRALQPGHLIDVASSDRHEVKPWFSGKLDYAPTVTDLASQGFPLAGGRLDYVGGRAVAVLVYMRRQHAIDVYVWPGARALDRPGARQGFNLLAWTQDGLAYAAVSDLDKAELAQFVALQQHR